ncbi:MAG TPA: sugar transferase [Hyphomicrobiaceae bacterium]|nr:sugar transferase [Hyphomicrobiaceae bacterium]
MSDVHQVLPPSSVLGMGDSAALRRRRLQLTRELRSFGRRLGVGAALMVGDLAVAWLAIALARLAVNFVMGAGNAELGHLPVEVLLLIFLTLGLYFGSGESPFARFRLRGMGIVLFVALDFLPQGRNGGVRLAAEAVLMAPLLLVLGFYCEALVRQLALRYGLWTAPTIVVGCGAGAQQLCRTLIDQPELGLKPIGFLSTAADESASHSALPMPLLGPIEKFAEIGHEAEVAILTSREQLSVANALSDTLPPAQLILVDGAQDIQTLWLRARTLGNAVGIQFKRDPYLSQNRFLKRALDLGIAVPAVIFSLPLVAALALMIWLVDRRSPFYVQTRVGRRGRPINVPKLRTMYVDAQARLEEHLRTNLEARNEWERYYKLTNDPRILPLVGSFIRRTSLDELPQLWSVIVGDMSLVGPRPFPQYHMNGFVPEFRQVRVLVPPGLTGLWQVSARSNGDLGVQRTLDTFYIRNWSIWLDLYILFQTFLAVVSAKGAK